MHRWDLMLASKGFICAEPQVFQVCICPPPPIALLPAVVGRGWEGGGSKRLSLSAHRPPELNTPTERPVPLHIPLFLKYLPGF